ncbi:MAG: hypothetical protein ACI96M_001813 [Candidatus Azotimanducaceae bacterium]|jgi:hypothetical protein
MLQQEDIGQLESELDSIKSEVVTQLQQQGNQLAAVQAGNANQTIVFQHELEALQERLTAEVRNSAKRTCQPAVIKDEACTTITQTVVMNDDRMVVGEMEKVLVEPPGFVTSARIDTGAQSSSLHAENVTEFERDGDDWVKFDVVNEDSTVTIERPVEKYVRVFQQSDKDGTRRAVVKMRILIGNVRDTFDFTLADRSHLAHNMILGRNFLTDIAVVDVGRQFVQPLPKQ